MKNRLIGENENCFMQLTNRYDIIFEKFIEMYCREVDDTDEYEDELFHLFIDTISNKYKAKVYLFDKISPNDDMIPSVAIDIANVMIVKHRAPYQPDNYLKVNLSFAYTWYPLADNAYLVTNNATRVSIILIFTNTGVINLGYYDYEATSRAHPCYGIMKKLVPIVGDNPYHNLFDDSMETIEEAIIELLVQRIHYYSKTGGLIDTVVRFKYNRYKDKIKQYIPYTDIFKQSIDVFIHRQPFEVVSIDLESISKELHIDNSNIYMELARICHVVHIENPLDGMWRFNFTSEDYIYSVHIDAHDSNNVFYRFIRELLEDNYILDQATFDNNKVYITVVSSEEESPFINEETAIICYRNQTVRELLQNLETIDEDTFINSQPINSKIKELNYWEYHRRIAEFMRMELEDRYILLKAPDHYKCTIGSSNCLTIHDGDTNNTIKQFTNPRLYTKNSIICSYRSMKYIILFNSNKNIKIEDKNKKELISIINIYDSAYLRNKMKPITSEVIYNYIQNECKIKINTSNRNIFNPCISYLSKLVSVYLDVVESIEELYRDNRELNISMEEYIRKNSVILSLSVKDRISMKTLQKSTKRVLNVFYAISKGLNIIKSSTIDNETGIPNVIDVEIPLMSRYQSIADISYIEKELIEYALYCISLDTKLSKFKEYLRVDRIVLGNNCVLYIKFSIKGDDKCEI